MRAPHMAAVWVESPESGYLPGALAEWPDDDGAVARDEAVLVSVGSKMLEVRALATQFMVDHKIRAGCEKSFRPPPLRVHCGVLSISHSFTMSEEKA